MTRPEQVGIRHLTADDLDLMDGLLTMFGEAFDEIDAYSGNRPSEAYLRGLLGSDSFIALAAVKDAEVVGGLAAYELHKFEQMRSEILVYDLAVAAGHRRRGIASDLLRELKRIAAERGARLFFIQAYRGDEPATALYSTFAVGEEVLHFEIAVDDPHS